MSPSLVLLQLLNGLQFGVLLFLLSAGLTLVLGIMNFVNLMHGSLYMLGAYFAAVTFNATGSFVEAAAAGVFGTLVVGVMLETAIFRKLYLRDHMTHVLATFGLILFFNELVSIIWGSGSIATQVPDSLGGAIRIFGIPYPTYRFAILVVGLFVAVGLYIFIHRTRIGILIRAGASNATMIAALGINIRRLNCAVVAIGAGLAGLAGFMNGPLSSVQPGMGGPILILTLVVIVTGGIGSIRGAFYGALIVGLVDTGGRVFLPALLRGVMPHASAQVVGASLASILIYLVMAAVLALRPQGLFPVKHG
ncbi:branched-chain amino acid ABC transporter permease [Paraburkholderia tuberum]|uniref:Amino acid/amide ABC transporter membrane protein 1, HAAT family n=1 Tax=Paraburkholderia tuberum TaxID=157910 RepID=A0A1H1KH33_9BURK|nr:branched-chain amino acid ABC transporter permease [Paraburkholderia tuberum]SDR61556.1 amino acid/amide ABC transporter membrane protein 1, HAAT family [Paraburkholderia tuberum]